MPEAISSAAIQRLTEQSLGTEAGSPGGAVNKADQAKFEAAMSQGGAGDAASGGAGVQGVEGASGAAETQLVDGPQSLGDAILDGLQNLRETHDHQMQTVTDQLQTVSDEPMSVGAAMQLQFDLMQMTLQQDITTKVADKTSQGVQTLFRNQG